MNRLWISGALSGLLTVGVVGCHRPAPPETTREPNPGPSPSAKRRAEPPAQTGGAESQVSQPTPPKSAPTAPATTSKHQPAAAGTGEEDGTPFAPLNLGRAPGTRLPAQGAAQIGGAAEGPAATQNGPARATGSANLPSTKGDNEQTPAAPGVNGSPTAPPAEAPSTMDRRHRQPFAPIVVPPGPARPMPQPSNPPRDKLIEL